MPYIEVLQKYAVFDGRASRREYWLWVLIHLIVLLVLVFVALSRSVADLFIVVVYLYGLATIVPNLAVGARRLHDHNKSGWLQLIWLVPLIGGIIVLILMVLPGTDGVNKHGPKPE